MENLNNTPAPSNTAQDVPVEAPETQEVESQEGSEETPEAPEANKAQTAAEKKAEAKRIKQLKLKVDKQEYTEELPFELPDDPKAIEYMTRQLQMARMGTKRAQDFASLQKQVERFFDEFRKNPRKVLSDPTLGVDLKQIVKEYIEEEISNSQKSPEQVEKEKLESRLRELEDERKREKEDWEKREMERLQEQAMERYDIQISTALEKSDLPKSPYVIKKITDYMMLGLQNDVDVTADDVIPLVREEIQHDLREMFGVMPEEVIENIIGKDVLGKLRKKNVAKAKATQTAPVNKQVKDVGAQKPKENKEPAKKMSYKDFFGF
jgi:hypothetical protein